MKATRALSVAFVLGLASVAAPAQVLELRRVDIRELPRVHVELQARDARNAELAGLLPSDFDVRFDGVAAADVEVAASAAGQGQEPPPVFLLVDRSGDLPGGEAHQVKKAADAVVAALPPATRIAIYSFDSGMREEHPLDDDRAKARAAIVNIVPGNGTSYLEPLNAVAERARRVDPRRAAIIFVLHARHYPGPAPAPGRAYSLPGQQAPIYPVVVPSSPLEETLSRIIRRLAVGMPGIYALSATAPFGADGQMHALSVALKNGRGVARCRFRAMRGTAITPSTALERELRDSSHFPWGGALAGALVAGLGVLILSRRDIAPKLPVRLGPVVYVCLLGLGAVVGAVVSLAAFPAL